MRSATTVPSTGAAITVRSSTSRLAATRCSTSANSDWMRLASSLTASSWAVSWARICSSASPIACCAWAMRARRSARLPSISARVALQREQPRLALQPLAVQLLHALDLLVDQGDLAAVRPDLRFEPRDLFAQLLDPLAQNALAVRERLGAGIEHGPLRDHRLERRRMRAGRLDQPVGKAHACGCGLFGEQARLGCGQRVETRLEHVEAGARLDVLEQDQRFARAHHAAVPHQDVADDTAFEMLHGAPAALGADHARRDRRAGERRARRPPAEAAEEQADQQRTGSNLAAQLVHERCVAPAGAGVRRADAQAAVAARDHDATAATAGGTARCTIRRGSTSSRAPNRTPAPSRSTSSLST